MTRRHQSRRRRTRCCRSSTRAASSTSSPSPRLTCVTPAFCASLSLSPLSPGKDSCAWHHFTLSSRAVHKLSGSLLLRDGIHTHKSTLLRTSLWFACARSPAHSLRVLRSPPPHTNTQSTKLVSSLVDAQAEFAADSAYLSAFVARTLNSPSAKKYNGKGGLSRSLFLVKVYADDLLRPIEDQACRSRLPWR